MTKLLPIVCWLVLALPVVGCGGDPCEECADLADDAIRAECERHPGCQFCECYAQGMIVDPSGIGCVTPAPSERDECTGTVEAAAEAKLDDGTCAAHAVETVSLRVPEHGRSSNDGGRSDPSARAS